MIHRPSGTKSEKHESGAIRPLVDKVFPLGHVRDRLAYSESGRATGKLVIKVA
jgi:NADPH:quinone reductase-like Zn-dependent oxidoreductase